MVNTVTIVRSARHGFQVAVFYKPEKGEMVFQQQTCFVSAGADQKHLKHGYLLKECLPVEKNYVDFE